VDKQVLRAGVCVFVRAKREVGEMLVHEVRVPESFAEALFELLIRPLGSEPVLRNPRVKESNIMFYLCVCVGMCGW
jgi:hypothetical protein